MNRIKVVTGYVPVPNHPRTAAEYGALGEKLGEIPVLKHAFYERLERCWLHKFVEKQNKRLAPLALTHSVGDNPAKNTMDYHIVQHQKFEWLGMAAAQDPSIDVFIWIDYGIFHVPGVTAAVILEFLAKVNDKDIAIPGCWDKHFMAPVSDAYPSWRFCGGVIVVPRLQIPALLNAVHTEVRKHTRQTKNITWEVNTLARVEQKDKVPIRWYQADHNATMFSGYGAMP